MTRFEAIKQGHIKIVDISIVCNFTVDKCGDAANLLI
ncbi:Uncharacterised protein [Shigella sonnei]|nr:Uncharacterised protein [Shigella sonnei]